MSFAFDQKFLRSWFSVQKVRIIQRGAGKILRGEMREVSQNGVPMLGIG